MHLERNLFQKFENPNFPGQHAGCWPSPTQPIISGYHFQLQPDTSKCIPDIQRHLLGVDGSFQRKRAREGDGGGAVGHPCIPFKLLVTTQWFYGELVQALTFLMLYDQPLINEFDSPQSVGDASQITHSQCPSRCIIAGYQLSMLVFVSILFNSVFSEPGTVLNAL